MMNTKCTLNMDKQFVRNEGGFIFAVTAMVVVIIISLMMIYLRSTVMLNISEAGEMLSTSQSYWSAVSGMEYAYEEAAINADSVPGTYSYYNSSIILESSLAGNDGGPITSGSLRFISTGVHGDTKRIVESSFQGVKTLDLWPPISVILEGGGSPGGGEEEECGECDGKVTQLTLQYNGSSSALIKVKQKRGEVVYNQTVSPGGTFTIVGVDRKGTLGTEISLYVNNRLNVKIHTSCSKPIGPGMVAGLFEIISGFSRNGGLLCDYSGGGGDECGECDGKVTQLTLQYNGSSSALIKVKQKRGEVVYNQTVSPGGTFTIVGVDSKGTLGTEISLYVNNNLNVKIHTSCSVPVGPGMVAGSFEIISGYSRNGGLLCGDGDGGGGDSEGFEIKNNTILNCSIFIGGRVSVESDAVVGSPDYGGPTIIYVPTGFTVTGNFNSTFNWAEYPDPTPTLPNFNHSPYDSLISISDAITSTGGNEYNGNLEINLTTFDLSSYANNTYFVKGDIKIKGSTITGAGSGGDGQASPGILVASGKIEIKKEHSTQSFIDDNIILIAKNDIKIEDYSQVGTDLSGDSPPCRPLTFNEVYSKKTVEIKEHAEVWAMVTARGELKLDGALYGIAFVPDGKFKMDKDDAYIEGAIFVKEMDNNEFKKGRMKLTHCFPSHYFSTRKFVPVKTTFKEI